MEKRKPAQRVQRKTSHGVLKTKHRKIRDSLPQSVDLRVHRALSWLDRAEREVDDPDAAFIFHWIAFNAAYAREIPRESNDGERSVFDEFFRKLNNLDNENRIYDAIWKRYPNAIRLLLTNKHVFAPFWRHNNGELGFADWADRFARSDVRLKQALAQKDTLTILSMVFGRLYVLRNQLIHGAATWNGSVNRSQVRDGASILGFLNPVFIDLLMDHPREDWGEPLYPVVA